jgi:hypothetical protein
MENIVLVDDRKRISLELKQMGTTFFADGRYTVASTEGGGRRRTQESFLSNCRTAYRREEWLYTIARDMKPTVSNLLTSGLVGFCKRQQFIKNGKV